MGSLVAALALTAVVGLSAVVVAPQLRDTSAATDTASPSTIERASLAAVVVKAAPAVKKAAADTEATDNDPAVPAASGSGRRIVFDQGDQRVWLVDDGNDVERTYLVSGSRFDNLQPGSYQVLSRTRQATAFDASGTMEYFVRFATGYSEPIGFHSVPRDNAGQLEQTKAQLGTPLSAGCVRQWQPDAIALWDFAPVGTPVVVTA